MTAMMLSLAASSGSHWVSRCHGNCTLFTGGGHRHRSDHERGGSAPLTAAALVRWLTHDLAHSFGVVDAVPGKTDEGGESHRARHGTDRRHGVASRRKYVPCYMP
jgi:hypothetical protein